MLAADIVDSFSYNGHDYLLMRDNPSAYPTTWLAAETHAQALGNHLATVDSLEENQQILTKFGTAQLSPLWIGLNDAAEGLVWSSGTELSFLNWDEGQPSSNEGFDFGQLIPQSDGKWGLTSNDDIGFGVIEVASPDVRVQLPDNPLGELTPQAFYAFDFQDYQDPNYNHFRLTGPGTEPLVQSPNYYRASDGFLQSLTIEGGFNSEVVLGQYAGQLAGFAPGATPGVTFNGGGGNDAFGPTFGLDFFDGGDGVDTVYGAGQVPIYGTSLHYGTFSLGEETQFTGWKYTPSELPGATVYMSSVEVLELYLGAPADSVWGLVDPSMSTEQIAEIVSELPSGANLLLAPGVYHNPIQIVGKSLTLLIDGPITGQPAVSFELTADPIGGIAPAAISWDSGELEDGWFRLQAFAGLQITNTYGDGISVSNASEFLLQDATLIQTQGSVDPEGYQVAAVRLHNVEQTTIFGGWYIAGDFDPNEGPVNFEGTGVGLAVNQDSSLPYSRINLGANFQGGLAGISVENAEGTQVDLNLGWDFGDSLWSENTMSFSHLSGIGGAYGGSDFANHSLSGIGVLAPYQGVSINHPTTLGSIGNFPRFAVDGEYPFIIQDLGQQVPIYTQAFAIEAELVNALPSYLADQGATAYFTNLNRHVYEFAGVDGALGRYQADRFDPPIWADGVLNPDGFVLDLTNGNRFLITGELILGNLDALTPGQLSAALSTASGVATSRSVIAEATSQSDVSNFLDVLSEVNVSLTNDVDINLNLAPLPEGDFYDGLNVDVPTDTSLNIDLGGSTIGPGSPALTVSGGQVVVANGTLTQFGDGLGTGEGNFPTILVMSGGSLTLGDGRTGVTVNESNVYNQVAIRVEAGGSLSLDANSLNTLNIVGQGRLIDYRDDQLLDLSDAGANQRLVFAQNNVAISSNLTVETLINHALDNPTLGTQCFEAVIGR